MEKLLTRKTASLIDTKKDMIPQKKLKTIFKQFQVTSKRKQMHNQPQKCSSVFQIYENKESLVVKTKKKEKLPVLWQFFSDKKSPQRKSASATIANPVELMNRTIIDL